MYPEVATRDGQLRRALDLKQGLYNTVASQYETLRLQSSKNVVGVQVVAMAEPPLHHSKSYKIIYVGAILGLFVSVFASFILEYIDGKRRSGDLTALTEAWRQDSAWLKRLRPH